MTVLHPRRSRALLLALIGVTAAAAARATITVDVNPQTTTVGQTVTIFGTSNCELIQVDFGDGSPIASVTGPAYSTAHIYTTPSPNPPGIFLISVQGVACLDAQTTNAISVIVNPGGGGGGPGDPPPPTPTTPVGTLFIERLGLHFENHRPEIRVEQNQKRLQAFAEVQYSGTGLLQGYWEVDGRIWSFVNRHLVFGNVVTLESPSLPGLPTTESGLHRVRLVLLRPATGYVAPTALYFAGFDQAEPIEPLLLVAPARRAVVNYAGNRFQWSGPVEAQGYRISFFDADSNETVFSAMSRTTRYDLPADLVESRFATNGRYEWQVVALDAQGEELTRSLVRPFAFDPPPGFVPGQLIVITESSMRGDQALARLRDEYGLREIRTDRLDSIDVRMTVFETREDVAALGRTVAREDGVLLAHPNFLMLTLSEPHAKLQKVRTVLNLDALHALTRGRQVRVAVVDSGIDATHPELEQRLVLRRNFIDGEDEVAEIHGTAVAGVIGASLNDAGIAGVAPEVSLLGLRACKQIQSDNPKARCETAHVARAVDAALMEGARVINMSFGTRDEIPLLVRLIEAGKRNAVLFTAPVGNAKWQRDVAFPARHPYVIAVAGQDESGAAWPNEILYRHSRIVAPATNVISSVPGNRYNFLSGTSLSSAIVAGLLALRLEQRPLTTADLPARNPNLCAWAERLTTVSLCTPTVSGSSTLH
jgi:hypothetical protein